jgi:Endomembrane protein 70
VSAIVTHMKLYCLVVVVLLGLFAAGVFGKNKKHHFNEGDTIDFYVNNVGPYANPTETYEYYTLPFCKPEKIVKKSQRLGEYIQGDRAILSEYDLPFKSMLIALLIYVPLRVHFLLMFLSH